jgi:hypothetical protein
MASLELLKLTKRSGLGTEGGRIADCHIFTVCSRKIWWPDSGKLPEIGFAVRV